MKRLYNHLFAFVAIAATLISCSKEVEAPVKEDTTPAKEGGFIMTVNTSNAGTKTVISDPGDGNYNINWSVGEDKLGVYEVANGTVQAKQESAVATQGAENSFTFTLPTLDPNPGAPYNYSFVYPASALDITEINSVNRYTVNIKQNQTFLANSFDPDADALISEHFEFANRPESINTAFARIGATARMVLKCPTTNETIKSITFSTTEGNISGYYTLNPATGELSEGIVSGQKSVILTPPANTPFTGEVVVWFRLAAITLTNNFKVTVLTNAKTYTKTVDLTAGTGRTIKFEDSKLTKFNVNMTQVNGVDHPVKDGWYVLAALREGNYFALSSTATTTGTRLSKVVLPNDFDPTKIYDASDDEAIAWKVTNGIGNVTIQTTDNKYLKSGDKSASTGTDSESFTLYEAESGTFEINSIDNAGYGIRYNYNSGSSFWAFYNSDKTSSMIGDIYFVPATVDTRTKVTLSFAESSIDRTTSNYNEFTGQVASASPNESAITSNISYSMTGDEIGTINSTGGVILNGSTGNATVTASFDGDETYRSASASYTISVSAPTPDTYYVKVTSAPSDWSGDYLIVYESSSTTGYVLTGVNSNNIGTYDSVSIDDSKILAKGNESYKITIGKVGNTSNYTMKLGNSYLAYTLTSTSKDNYLYAVSDASTNGTSWTLSTDDARNVYNTSRYLRWNNTSNQYRFCCYTSGQQKISFFKLEDNTPRYITAAYDSDPAHGSISFNPTSPTTTGKTVTINAVPDEGYVLTALKYNDGTEDHVIALNDMSFTMPAADVTVTATFKKQSTVTIAYGSDPAHGSISISPSSPVVEGATVSIVDITPDTHYALSALKYNDGSDHGILEGKSFTMPATDVTVTATFSPAPYITLEKNSIDNVPAAGVSNGSVSGVYTYYNNASDDDITVEYDGTVVTAAEKNNGGLTYTVAENTTAARNGWIKIKCGSEDALQVTVNQLVASYQLTLEGDNNGTVTATVDEIAVESGSFVLYGKTVSITAAPNDATTYQLASLVYNDGSDHDIKSTKSFTMPAHDVTVNATFDVAVAKTNQMLFHETFGDNSNSARAWDDSYSVKSGVSGVYSGITSYTVSNVKQGKNTTGSTQSGLNQSSQGTDASIIIGPLSVANAENMILTYQWNAGSIKGTYSTTVYYKTTSNGSFTEVTGTGSGATSFVTRTYNLPKAAQVSTLYLKIVWNTSNTSAIIDEVNLQGDYPPQPSNISQVSDKLWNTLQ